ncbi:MAG: type I-E CRISPR-associated protein Cas7/Cse4/CasC, partial [Chlorobiales bacterium]|nr:type I-E CRISPR-associated protein Cas7/Cse4/CasC [Chlorobiales bacterium]
MNNNPFKGHRIEFHILQAFPVTCLNRDDVGAPKTAMVGGSTRARISSQCWKRQVRLSMHELGIPRGFRTKLISPLIEKSCKDKGASDEQAKACGEKFEQIFIKTKDDKKAKKSKKVEDTGENDAVETEQEKTDTLLFLSPNEAAVIANAFAEKGFVPEDVITKDKKDKQAGEVAKLLS